MMPDILHELENNEAVLLMYLADELPPQDKAEVEQMLASDRSMNELFLELQLAHAASLEAFRLVDMREPLPVPPRVAARRAKASIQQWTQDRFKPVVADVERPVKKTIAWQRYAAIAASLLMILGGVWLIMRAHRQDAVPQMTAGDARPQIEERVVDDTLGVDPALRDALEKSTLTADQQTALLEGSLAPAPTTAPSDAEANATINDRADEPVIGLDRPQWQAGDVLSDLFDGAR